MKRIVLITILILGIYAYAQTPFDSFAPEVSKPMLGLKEPVDRPETIQYAIVADMQSQTLLLVDVSCGEVIATAPISDDLSKWLSVDPLADKYPNISPYAYAAWNPIKYVDPDGKIVQVFDADGVATLYNTLSASDRTHVSVDEQGFVTIDQEHVLHTESSNYKVLAELVGSSTTYTIATGNSFEYKNEEGLILCGYMSPVQVIPDFGPDAFGFDTNETGWLGVTQTPGEQPNKYNSLDNGVHVLLNSTLSAEGKAQMLSHELYGHALLYQRNQPHTHDVRNGVEQNSLLRAAIIMAISETKQNMRGR